MLASLETFCQNGGNFFSKTKMTNSIFRFEGSVVEREKDAFSQALEGIARLSSPSLSVKNQMILGLAKQFPQFANLQAVKNCRNNEKDLKPVSKNGQAGIAIEISGSTLVRRTLVKSPVKKTVVIIWEGGELETIV